MTLRSGISFGAAGALVAAFGLMLPSPGLGQGKGKGKGNPEGVIHAPIPIAVDGKPDLSGVWQAFGVSISGEDGAPPLVPLPPIDNHPIERAPLRYKPEWEARRKNINDAVDDPTLYCLLAGVPRIVGMPMPFEIVQKPDKVVILYEVFHGFRIIPIRDDLRHPDDITPTWMGDSVGRWEGDTFVVDVTGFNDKTWIAGAGSIHSEDMHVVERYTLNDDGSLTYQVTVEDPVALEAPHKTGYNLRAPIDVRVEEYECIENNPDPAHIKAALGVEE